MTDIDLTQYERVECQLCRVSMSGKEVPSHDASAAHQTRLQSHRVDLAIQKVTGYAGCPGPCFPVVFRSWA